MSFKMWIFTFAMLVTLAEVQASCVTGWTEFFDTSDPKDNDGDEFENVLDIRRNNQFCVGGELTAADCLVYVEEDEEWVDYKTVDVQRTRGLSCKPSKGSYCSTFSRKNLNPCMNVKIRFFCQCACGGNFTDREGAILSPNYPKPYHNGLACRYVIGQRGHYVTLTFDDFFLEGSTECQFDFVVIYDEGNTTGTGRFCGTDVPAPRTMPGPIYIQFETDRSFVAPGFLMRYQIAESNPEIVCGIPLCEAGCSIDEHSDGACPGCVCQTYDGAQVESDYTEIVCPITLCEPGCSIDEHSEEQCPGCVCQTYVAQGN